VSPEPPSTGDAHRGLFYTIIRTIHRNEHLDEIERALARVKGAA